MRRLEEAILFVGETHGLGFGKSVVQELVEAELAYQQIKLVFIYPLEKK